MNPLPGLRRMRMIIGYTLLEMMQKEVMIIILLLLLLLLLLPFCLLAWLSLAWKE